MKSKTNAKIQALIDSFKSHVVENQKIAQEAAIAALGHLWDHGDPIYVNKMLDVLEGVADQYLRPAAFIEWTFKFAPVKAVKVEIDDNTTVRRFGWDAEKAKEFMAKDEAIAKATAMKWWKAKRNTELAIWSFLDVDKALLRVVNSFLSESRAAMVADPAALQYLAQLKGQFEGKVAMDKLQHAGDNVVSFGSKDEPSEEDKPEMSPGEVKALADLADEQAATA